MKLLLTTRMGDPYFGLLDDLPDIQKVWATTPEEIAREIVDADVVYGWPTLEQFQAAQQLEWIQVPSAGVEMQVLAVDVESMPDAPHGVEVWGSDRLPELFEQSDVVVVAAPFTPQTRHLIDADLLERMKPTAYLPVESRGGIVDESALLDVLKKGKITAAGLDVFEQEPLGSDSELWDVPNLIMTPHLAGASIQKDRRCVEILRENLGRFQRGETLINLVDKRKGY